MEGLGPDIQLVHTNLTPNSDVVFAADHIEGVRDGKYVSSSLKGSKTAIAKRPVIADDGRAKPATFAVLS